MAWNVVILGGGCGGLSAARTVAAALVGITWRGFPAWFLARTDWAMMPGMKRQLRLVVDRTVDLLFGRDTSELGHPPVLGMETAGESRAQDAPAVRH